MLLKCYTVQCKVKVDSIPYPLYLGRECQVKNWKDHKAICDVMVATAKT